jgi:hypothetical protein
MEISSVAPTVFRKQVFCATNPITTPESVRKNEAKCGVSEGMAGEVILQPNAKYSIVKDHNRGFGSVRRKGRDPLVKRKTPV